VIEVLHSEVGPDRIRKAIVKPLHGMVLAVHPGCHLLRPSHSVQFDNPLQPTKYDELVTALGAKSLAYTTKMNCCGGALGHVGEVDESTALAQRKLLEVHDKGADALTTCCPECFLQYDTKQAVLKRKGDKMHVPVLTYPELLGLALGITPEELGLASHRVSVESFLASWEERSRIVSLAAKEVDLAAAERCYQCGACASDCPVALNDPTFNPNRLVGEFCAGRIEELLEGGEFWRCLECHTCLEMCPQNFGMERVFTTLKHIAIGRRVLPSGVNIGLGMFVKTGRLGEPDDRARKRLGLSELPEGGAADLRRLLAADENLENPESDVEEAKA
jgi:heterodisulfide reductase subunit C